MCNPASFVLTKDRVFWSKLTDSHDEIVKEFSLCESIRNESVSTMKVCLLKVEIIPPKETDFATPLDQWVFRVDSSPVPKWFDAVADEKRARNELVKWAAAKIISKGERSIKGGAVYASGSASVRASGSASVTASGSASVTAYDSASVRASDSASVRASGSASVTAYDSASVRASGSASVTAYDSASVRELLGGVARFFNKFTCKISGKFSVVIDMTGDAAACYVGEEKARVITNIKEETK